MKKKKEVKNEYLEIYKKLPGQARDLFWSEEVVLIIKKLEKRYNIKGNAIPVIVGFVLLGLIPLSNIPKTLRIKARIPEKEAEDLADDIKRHILLPVKSFLEEAYEEELIIKEKKESDEEIEVALNRAKKDPYKEPLE
jgi:hypothetical protein